MAILIKISIKNQRLTITDNKREYLSLGRPIGERFDVNQFRQKVKQLKNHQVIKSYPISTALKGIGQNKNSFQTPIGLHYIRAKIGKGLPVLSIFEGRRPTGKIWNKDDAKLNPNHDWILSRILWLSGKKYGVNRLGTVDTMQRYIYIHGTHDESGLGKPLSHGCIRMSNNDVIELFDLVSAGTIVHINEE